MVCRWNPEKIAPSPHIFRTLRLAVHAMGSTKTCAVEFISEVIWNKESWWKCSTRMVNLAEMGRMHGKGQRFFELDWCDGSGPRQIEWRYNCRTGDRYEWHFDARNKGHVMEWTVEIKNRHEWKLMPNILCWFYVTLECYTSIIRSPQILPWAIQASCFWGH